MKLVIHYLESIEGVGIYPIIALLIFLPIFITMLVYAIRMPKKESAGYANMPLEDDDNDEFNNRL